MRIKINSHTVFLFPTGVIANRFTAGIISMMLEKEGVHLTKRQIKLFIKEIKRFKNKHPEWNLIEICDDDKDTIEVKF